MNKMEKKEIEEVFNRFAHDNREWKKIEEDDQNNIIHKHIFSA